MEQMTIKEANLPAAVSVEEGKLLDEEGVGEPDAKKQIWIPLDPSQLEPPEPLLSEIFHENTKMDLFLETQVGMKIGQILSNEILERTITQSYKHYFTKPRIELPSVNGSQRTELAFEDVVLGRRTIRNYSGSSITLETLAKILYLSYGISGVLGDAGRVQQEVRVVASGGGLYPLEIYPIVLRVDGLEPGLYHYNVKFHRLEFLYPADFMDQLAPVMGGVTGQTIQGAAVIFAVTGVFARVTFKYASRGYRFVLMECGALGEQVQLVGTALNVGVCQVAGFHDDAINLLLGVDGVNEAVLILIVIGAL